MFKLTNIRCRFCIGAFAYNLYKFSCKKHLYIIYKSAIKIPVILNQRLNLQQSLFPLYIRCQINKYFNNSCPQQSIRLDQFLKSFKRTRLIRNCMLFLYMVIIKKAYATLMNSYYNKETIPLKPGLFFLNGIYKMKKCMSMRVCTIQISTVYNFILFFRTVFGCRRFLKTNMKQLR